MSDNVIDINANKPHWTDAVTCAACGHQWQAVAPVGTDDAAGLMAASSIPPSTGEQRSLDEWCG